MKSLLNGGFLSTLEGHNLVLTAGKPAGQKRGCCDGVKGNDHDHVTRVICIIVLCLGSTGIVIM